MSNSTLTEAERNRIADVVTRQGGDELLVTETIIWAEGVRAAQAALELVIDGMQFVSMQGGELTLTPLHLSAPAPRPTFTIGEAPRKLLAVNSGVVIRALKVSCPECGHREGQHCVDANGAATPDTVHALRYDRSLRETPVETSLPGRGEVIEAAGLDWSCLSDETKRAVVDQFEYVTKPGGAW
jgi:hypothetical protein